MPDKLAFAHIPKCGGSYLLDYLTHRVLSDRPHLRLTLRCAEQQQAINRCWELGRGLFSSHYFTPAWGCDRRLFDQFRSRGWFLFLFVRDPREVLCSSYFYLKAVTPPAYNNLVDEQFDTTESLDAYIRRMANVELFPKYWPDYDFAAEFRPDHLATFFRTIFGHAYQPQAHINASRNPGYSACRQRQLITPETGSILDHSENLRTFREIQQHAPPAASW